MTCNDCGCAMKGRDAGMTMVAYQSPPGHDHDDNCVFREYACENGHKVYVSKRRSCHVAGCGWKGKESCFCHGGTRKLDEWPE